VIRLGLRLAVSGGREAAARLVVTAAAVALGVSMLLAALSAINAVHAQNARFGWLVSSSTSADSASGSARLWWMLSGDYFHGERVGVVDVATGGPDSPVPPGIAQLPAPGEYYASPALSELLHSTPAAELGDRFAGTEVGTIGPDALPSPDTLLIVIGHSPEELSQRPGVERVSEFRAGAPGTCSRCLAIGVIETNGIELVLAVTAGALLFPVLMFIGTATRLSAARREQRFAAMRLVGATPRQIAVIAAVESTVAAVVGVGAGFGLFAALRPLLARIPFTGARLFTDDLSLTTTQILVVALGVPAAAAIVARLSLRRVRISPLGVSRSAEPTQPSAWRVVPMLLGLGELVFWVVVGNPATTEGQIAAYLSGILVTMVGLLMVGPWLTMVASRLVVRRAARPAALIAGRRLSHNPQAGFRAVSGLVLALFVTSATVGVITTIVANRGTSGSHVADDALVQRFGPSDQTTLSSLPDNLLSDLRAISGVTGVTVIHSAPATTTATDFPNPRLGVVSCLDLEDTPFVESCPAGSDVVTTDPNVPPPRFRAESVITQGDGTGTASTVSLAELEALPVEAIVVATDGSDAAIEHARTALELAAPDHERPITLGEDAKQSTPLLSQWKQLAKVVILTSLPIAGCSLAVSVAAGLNDRKRPFSLLRLTGAPLRVLRQVVAFESAVPLLLSAVVSVGVGLLAAHLFLMSQMDYTLVGPGVDYYLLTIGGLVAALAILGSTLPLLQRLTGPETARSE
jgi:hypothetical protein